MYIDAIFTLLSCCHTNRSEEVLFVAPRTACRHAVLEIRRIRKTTAACKVLGAVQTVLWLY
jgi:hypothetical protein